MLLMLDVFKVHGPTPWGLVFGKDSGQEYEFKRALQKRASLCRIALTNFLQDVASGAEAALNRTMRRIQQ